jgi:hypothetical protein
LEEAVRKTKWDAIILALALALSLLGVAAAAAPQPGEQSQNDQATKKEEAQDSGVYRVSYKVNEVENGKVINSRSYILMAKAGEREFANIGSRIPVAFQGKLDYRDVGMAVSCTIRPGGEKLVVHSEFNLNTIADKEAASTIPPPVMRQFYLHDDTAATLGKPAFVGSIDDIASNRRYVIEVTVTKAE